MSNQAFEQRGSRRIRSGLMKVRLGGPTPQDALEILDISLRGMGVRVSFAMATGHDVVSNIYHPILAGPISLDSRVIWCQVTPGESHPAVGLEFLSTTDADRMALRQIQASEVSCRVLDGERMAGFVLNQAESRWALYDENTFKVALMTKIGPKFQVTFLGATPSESVHEIDADSLPEALQLALDLSNPPFVVPPEGGHWIPVSSRPPGTSTSKPARPSVPRAPRVPARGSEGLREQPALESRTGKVPTLAETPVKDDDPTPTVPPPGETGPGAFHSVLAGGFHVGYVACTSVDDTWSLYDTEWHEVAIISPHQTRFKLVYMGSDPNDSLDFLMAKTWLGGIQIGFDLKVQPTIDPPIVAELDPSESNVEVKTSDVGPIEDSDEETPLAADADHHCILDRDLGLIGFIAKIKGGRNWWAIYTTSREKVATIGKDGDRYRILFVGQNPGDSLEYMVARSFRGALALTFDLESLPKLEPPLP